MNEWVAAGITVGILAMVSCTADQVVRRIRGQRIEKPTRPAPYYRVVDEPGDTSTAARVEAPEPTQAILAPPEEEEPYDGIKVNKHTLVLDGHMYPWAAGAECIVDDEMLVPLHRDPKSGTTIFKSKKSLRSWHRIRFIGPGGTVRKEVTR